MRRKPPGQAVCLAVSTAFVLVTALGCEPQAGRGSALSVQPIEVETATGLPLILLPGGRFSMGNEEGASDERPVHEVEVSGFAMDKFEVTQDLLAKLEVPNPSHFKGAKRPIEQVRWSDAAEICNLRSEAEGLEPCYDLDTFACDFTKSGYRLPTEAEWEYAATAGGSDPGPRAGAQGPRGLAAHACYAGSSSEHTALVGSHRPNAWGFCDLLGNVAEWCHDVYDANHYAASPARDPRGPSSGKDRVLRGGSWASPADDCRPTRRFHDAPGISDACFARNTYGFRCVRRLSAAEENRLAPSVEGRSASGAPAPAASGSE